MIEKFSFNIIIDLEQKYKTNVCNLTKKSSTYAKDKKK